MTVVWTVGLVAGAILLYFLYAILVGIFGSKGRLQTKLVLANAVAIADAVEGQRVKVIGVVQGDGAECLVSRVSGQPLVCSHLALTYHRTGDSRYFERDRNTAFVIEDDSGRAEIKVETASIQFGDRSQETRLEGELDGWARQAIEENGVTFAGVATGRLDILERSLMPGDRVAVLGLARWTGNAEAGPRSEGGGQRRLTIASDPEIGVVISGQASAFDD